MNFGKYFYHLLHRIFKRQKSGQVSDTEQLMNALGNDYDELQEAIIKYREQALIFTADEQSLELHGWDRKLPRFKGESVEDYRRRLMNAFTIHSENGSYETMKDALQKLGFRNSNIEEYVFTDPERWSQFRLLLGLRTPEFSETERNNIVATINRIKPKHTKLASLDIESPANDQNGQAIGWEGEIEIVSYACPLPSEDLYPSEELYPC